MPKEKRGRYKKYLVNISENVNQQEKDNHGTYRIRQK
jgi:hypothetical protein